MRFPSKEAVERLRGEYPVGCRVELLKMDDAQAPPIGTLGTVRGVDDVGSIMVNWDNGGSLSVAWGEDLCRRVNTSISSHTEDAVVAMLAAARKDIIRLCNSMIEAAIKTLSTDNTTFLPFEADIMLYGNYGFFKGKKPVAVLFSEENEVPVQTWKHVVKAILAESVEHQDVREFVETYKDRIAGKSRVLLSSTPNSMDSPIEITDGLFFETKFDTETLLYSLCERVLVPSGYDITNIRIRVRWQGGF